MADLAGCTRHTVESIEYDRLGMSAQLGARIAAATNCDYGWLMASDAKRSFVNSDGRPYTKEDAERASVNEASESIQYAHSGPEIAILVAADLLHRVLQAARARNANSSSSTGLKITSAPKWDASPHCRMKSTRRFAAARVRT